MDDNQLVPQTSPQIHPLIWVIPSATLFLSFTYYLLIPPTKPLSPLAYPQAAPVVRQSLSQPDVQPLPYYLAASRKYLQQARAISHHKGAAQTPTDRQEIITLLSESLKMANNAVLHYAQSPAPYLNRAVLFDNISVIDPSVVPIAKQDREIAARLGGGENINIDPSDLIQAQPIQEANLGGIVAIAFPQDKTLDPIESSESSNTRKGVAVIPAGQTQVIVNPLVLTPDDLVYFTPRSSIDNHVLTLSSKSTCSESETSCHPAFTLSLESPMSRDISVDWWIVE